MKQLFSSIRNKVSLVYLNSGMKVMSFRNRHPYIFMQLLLIGFGILGDILFTIYQNFNI